MSDLYLIAHLVRGAPAFDIASQIETDSETIWIIPTSGHRAWPYWQMSLAELQPQGSYYYNGVLDMSADPPPDHPDHYSTPTTKGGLLTNLASALGFKREEVKRRV